MSETSYDVAVIGSINMDLVVRAPAIPQPGQTVLGRDFATFPGGKGVNQAVAAARLGARCAMVGCTGEDEFGARLLANLRENNVDTQWVRTTQQASTGVAQIVVTDGGENAICVAPGANRTVEPSHVIAAEPLLGKARVCLLQLELPIETVCQAIASCQRLGVETILDPAPAVTDPPRELFEADIITPNAGEAGMLTGLNTPTQSDDTTPILDALRERGARRIVLKLGRHGAVICDEGQRESRPAHSITPVDTTAAGDAFSAALAVERSRGRSLLEAARVANAAGALACTRYGAQPSLPTVEQVRQLLAGR